MELYHLQLCLKLGDMLKEKCDEAWEMKHPSSKLVLSNEVFPHIAISSTPETFFQVWASLSTREKVRSLHSKKLFVQSFIESVAKERNLKFRYRWLINNEKRYKMYILSVSEVELLFDKNEITSIKLGIL